MFSEGLQREYNGNIDEKVKMPTEERALHATPCRLKSHLLRIRNLPTDRTRNYYAGSTLVAMRKGSSTLNYMLGDHPSLSLGTGLGSKAITTNNSGGKVAEIRYYPWGTERYKYGTTPTHPSLCSGQAHHFTSESIKTVKACRHGRHCRRAEAGEWDRIVYLWGEVVAGESIRHRRSRGREVYPGG
jgi:hypothetical protein